MTERVIVAKIGAAHGVRGEVKLWPFTQDPMAVADYGPLETKDGAHRFEIETVRTAGSHLVARLKGIADRDAAALALDDVAVLQRLEQHHCRGN